ncbi:MAG: helix-turn-helix transcriptional regulator [Candidatus Poribacteria bacterium]|jgi:transcriptional regulator with XRE-family HTH domain|nr:helix-turn-helix transcriptional regulator [Candidatus Poribacteria bacterium]MDP6751009.1 helix-turn-helix transcriptional regulator [Candidatus Poribacteria bacterium]
MQNQGTTLTIDADFGRRIQQLRKSRGWSREELAQRLKRIDPKGVGVSSRSVARIELAQKNAFKYRSLDLLAQAFELELEDLLTPPSISVVSDPLFELFQLQFRSIETSYANPLDYYQRLIDDLQHLSNHSGTDLISRYYQGILTHHRQDQASALEMLAKLHRSLQDQSTPVSQTDHSRLKILQQVNFQLGHFLEQDGNYIQAARYYRQAQAVSQSLNDAEGVANGHLLRGILAYHQQDWSRSLEVWQQGLQLPDCPLFFQARLHNMIGQAHKRLANLSVAEQAFRDSIILYQGLLKSTDSSKLPLRLAEKVPYRLAEAQTNLSGLYLETGQLEAAETINQQVLTDLTCDLKREPNHRQIASFLDLAYFQQAQLQIAHGQNDAGRRLLRRVVESPKPPLDEHYWIYPQAQSLLQQL